MASALAIPVTLVTLAKLQCPSLGISFDFSLSSPLNTASSSSSWGRSLSWDLHPSGQRISDDGPHARRLQYKINDTMLLSMRISLSATSTSTYKNALSTFLSLPANVSSATGPAAAAICGALCTMGFSWDGLQPSLGTGSTIDSGRPMNTQTPAATDSLSTTAAVLITLAVISFIAGLYYCFFVFWGGRGSMHLTFLGCCRKKSPISSLSQGNTNARSKLSGGSSIFTSMRALLPSFLMASHVSPSRKDVFGSGRGLAGVPPLTAGSSSGQFSGVNPIARNNRNVSPLSGAGPNPLSSVRRSG